MTYEEILKSIKDKKFKPVYLLHGEEGYFIDSLVSAFENDVLNESEKAFNFTVAYGKDANPKSIMDTASRYPMMAEYQLIILKEAQQMKQLDALIPYLKNPVSSTILVIAHKDKKVDMRKAFGKTVKKTAEVYESKKLYDNQIPNWIVNYVKSKGLKITPNASVLIAEYLGTKLSNVVNELNKLAINFPKGSEITDKDVDKHIGISKDYNVFELQNAIAEKSAPKAMRIVNYFIANPKKNPLPMVIGSLYGFYSKIYLGYDFARLSDMEFAKGLGYSARNEYAASFYVSKYKKALRNYPIQHIENAIGWLSEYDMRSKGVENGNTNHGELLKEMVYLMVG